MTDDSTSEALRQTQARQYQAAQDFVNGYVPGDAAGQFSGLGEALQSVATSFLCREADVIAELFRAFGNDAAADTFLDMHAEGDDDAEDDDADHIARKGK